MKKLILIITLLTGSLVAFAQTIDNTFSFIDADGNVVNDGKTVNLTTVEEDEDPETGEISVLMPSGMSVLNNNSTPAAMRINMTIERMDGGIYQICFPINCLSYNELGFYQTPATSIEGGGQRNLNTEWLPDENGICNVKLQIEVMMEMGTFPNFRYVHLADGPTITLHYNYGIPETVEGDINNDGLVDVEDVNAAINIILKIKTVNDYPGNADVTGDNIIDVEDVNVIINKILKQNI